ncbi:MAG: hypothetical protein JJT96_20420, partial [Opitutales bacterium]|nr:hypothetical protein [Opitutales bacterium]
PSGYEGDINSLIINSLWINFPHVGQFVGVVGRFLPKRFASVQTGPCVFRMAEMRTVLTGHPPESAMGGSDSRQGRGEL